MKVSSLKIVNNIDIWTIIAAHHIKEINDTQKEILYGVHHAEGGGVAII